MAVVSMNYLLEAGVHFGHQTKRWNPKMKEYIFTARDNIHIIDLQKTAVYIEEAYNVLKGIAENGGKVLYVGTKKQAQEAVREEAERTKMFYVNERWLGGTLTNFKTIRRSINYLMSIEKMEQDGTFDKLPKKEVIKLKKEYEKLNRNLCGIREMIKLPDVIVIVDPKKELNAIKEARRLNIPVIGIVDTNCDPDDVDYVIPANDDAIRAVKLVIGVLNNAVAEVTGSPMIDFLTEEDKGNVKKAEVKEQSELKEEKSVKESTELVEEKVEKESVEEIKEDKSLEKEDKKEPKKEEKKTTKKVAKKEEPKEVKKVAKKVATKKEVVKKATTKKEEPKEVKKTVKKVTTKKESKKEEKKTTKKATKK